MSIPIIHYRLFVDNKPHEASQSIIVLVGFSLKCCPVRPDTLDHLRVLELMNVEELSTILSSPEFIATDNLTLVISDGTIDSCRNILNKFSGSVYTFDAKRSLIYSSVNVLRHIGLTVNPVLFESKYRQRFFELTTDIAQYVWFRFFFSILSKIHYTDVSRRELLTYLNHQTTCKQFKSIDELMDDISDPINLYTITGPIYPNLTSILPSKDINKLFVLRYAINLLNSQMEKSNSERDESVCRSFSLYRGVQSSIQILEQAKAGVGSIIGKASFGSFSFDENTAKSFATGDMNHAYKQPVLQKINISTKSGERLHRSLSCKSQSFGDIMLLPYQSLFRVIKVERTELFWYIEADLVDDDDEQFCSVIGPWAKLINEECSFKTGMQKSYFRYLDTNSTSFLKFQVLIDALLRLDTNEFAKEELIELCLSKYVNDRKTLNQIDVFAQNYRREDAAYWYSRDWFLFRTLNEALHQENYDTIIKLRCFIRDLHNQLAALQIDYLQSSPHNQPNIVLYRGQTIPRSEIEWLQRYQCSLISMNSFLSTTNSYQAAVFFSGEGTADVDQGYVSVIFEILVDTRLPLNVPFARINYQSIFQDEEEILFSMATTFRIQDVEKIRDNFWCVKIKLEKNLDDEQWQLLTSHLNA
ncbi:unnamed protein product [Rotaria magnacalcarata]|uniref:Uncharacterized protein n=3 Tax=Rotaria magnacalcarata TaxID=392030 RepID=A0A820BBE3_9BILA|nr:unnamed protein product [Rotaria magnacalcarata]CAF4272116.1 unnamed protein product [Rotaria magnacalcarata]